MKIYIMSLKKITGTDLTSEGFIVLIEGDNTKNNEWFKAYDWQRDEFSKALNWGTMKSMGAPNEYEISKRFSKNGYEYCFIIFQDWNPCFMINLTTKKIREVKYFNLNKERFHFHKKPLLQLGITEEQISTYNMNRKE